MSCYNENIYTAPIRVTLCLSEQLRLDVSCENPDITWSPGGQTTDTIPLELDTEYTVNAECDGCGDPIEDTYCVPYAYANCSALQSFYVECSGTKESGNYYSLYVDYCPGIDIDGASTEFNYLRVPDGLTLQYIDSVDFGGGTWGIRIKAIVDWSLFEYPGVYYVMARVSDVNGIKSNWATQRVYIEYLNEEDTCC